MAIHVLKTPEKEYTLNFNSYAVMQAFRKYGAEGLASVTRNELNFEMIRWGLSNNGAKAVEEAEVYELIDSIGGLFSEQFTELSGWVLEAFNIPSDSKKKETEA